MATASLEPEYLITLFTSSSTLYAIAHRGYRIIGSHKSTKRIDGPSSLLTSSNTTQLTPDNSFDFFNFEMAHSILLGAHRN